MQQIVEAPPAPLAPAPLSRRDLEELYSWQDRVIEETRHYFAQRGVKVEVKVCPTQ